MVRRRAQTTVADTHVTVILRDALTVVEQRLAEEDEHETVRVIAAKGPGLDEQRYDEAGRGVDRPEGRVHAQRSPRSDGCRRGGLGLRGLVGRECRLGREGARRLA